MVNPSSDRKMLDLSILALPDNAEDMRKFIMTCSAIALSNKDIKIDEEVWDLLVRMKHDGRYRSVNDLLRVKFGLDVTPRSFVKNYADQSLNEGVLVDDNTRQNQSKDC